MIEQLTQREQEVLQLIIEGLTNAEIADELVVGVSTVKKHINNLYSKMGVSHRTQAIARARELALIENRSIPAQLNLPNNIPAQFTTFIGRDADISNILNEIDNQSIRLLTILASGGMGKTHLSIEIADKLLKAPQSDTHFKNGIFFIELAPLRNPNAIYSAIAEATGYEITDGRNPQREILKYLSSKRMLLIFDNFEHLLDGAEVINQILKSAPDIKVLVTSRERLNLQGESIYTLSGMKVEVDGKKLFIDYARRVRNYIDLNDESLTTIIRICRLVDGMPLAIVMAAAWLDVLPLADIPDEISQSLDFLSTETQDTPERHSSIRAVFEPTWKRLSENSKSVFMKLAIFRGGFTREAAKAIAGADIRTLQLLVNRALIQLLPNGRYDMHELLRQYVLEHLEASGEVDAVYEKHCQFFINFLVEREADIKGKRQIEALDEIERDFENVVIAWHWAFERGYDEKIHAILECCNWYIFMRVDSRINALGMLQQSVEKVSDHSEWLVARMTLRTIRGRLAFAPLEESKQKVEAILSIAIERGDEHEIAYCHALFGSIARRAGNYEESIIQYQQALDIYEELDDSFYVGATLIPLGRNYTLVGRNAEAIETFEEAARITQAHGNLTGYGTVLRELGGPYWSQGNVEKAQEYYLKSIDVMRLTNHKAGVAWSSAAVAVMYIIQDQINLAESYLSESSYLAEQFDVIPAKVWLLIGTAYIHLHNKNFRKAEQVTEEAYRLARYAWTVDEVELLYSIMKCHKGDYISTIIHLRKLISYALRTANHISILFPPAVILAALENSYGHDVYAVELLSAVAHHDDMPPVIIPLHFLPFYEDLHTELRESLGEDAYQAAWELGKSLNLEQALRDFLESHSNE